MNPKVEAFLDEAKQKAKATELQQRKNHLIFLGFTDDEKTERRYFSYFIEGCEFDEGKRMYYKDYPAAVEVTNEEYAEICKYVKKEDAEICKYVKKEDSKSNTPEKTLSTIATVVLWVGIIGSVILFIAGIALCNNYEEEIGYSMLIAIIPLLASNIITWAVLKVLCNISNNLRDINQKN